MPAQFALDLAWVNGIAEVVARAIANVGDKLAVGVPVSSWIHAVKHGTDGLH